MKNQKQKLIRIPEDAHEQLKIAAIKNGISLREQIERVILFYFKGREK